MMVSPDMYIQDLESYDYDTLIEERGKLIADIVEYETKEKSGDRAGDEWMMHPSPEVIYQMNLEYLSKLCLIMKERYSEDYVWGDKRLSDIGE